MPPIRDDLRAAVTTAMKARDRAALAVYRAALAAIDNAEAVPAEPSGRSSGRTEVPRRALTERDVVGIVAAEAGERRTAADALTDANPAAADRLRREAELLDALLPP